MPSFTDSKIYKLSFGVSDHFYIGSTTQDLSKRLSKHRTRYINHKTDLFNVIMDSNLEDWKIELIENYSCDNKNELRKREQYFIDLLKPTMNTVKAYKNDVYLKSLTNDFDTERKKRVLTLSQRKKDYEQVKKLEKAKYKEEYESKFIICGCGKKIYNIPFKVNIHNESAKHKKYLLNQGL